MPDKRVAIPDRIASMLSDCSYTRVTVGMLCGIMTAITFNTSMKCAFLRNDINYRGELRADMDLDELLHALTSETRIQSTYFTDRPRSRLWFLPTRPAPAPSQDLCIPWAFTFTDLGMTHTLRGKVRISVRDGFICVNNRRVNSFQEAEERAFKGKYTRALRALYVDLDIHQN